MRRLQLGMLTAAAASFLMALTIAGCSGGNKDGGTAEGDKTEEKKPAKKAEKKAVAHGAGTLKGRVTIEGAKPDTQALTAKLLEDINKKPDDKGTCLSPDASPEEKSQQEWRISDSGGVANVFVYLKPAAGTYFEVKADDPGVKAVKDKEVVIDQPHCAFVPHAAAYFPGFVADPKSPKKLTSTGQKFIVKNGAKISHNTKLSDTAGDQTGFNETIKAGDTKPVTNLVPSENPVLIQCTIHPWMSSTCRVFNHPYYAITDKDGNYEIKNVPAGDVQVVAWHEAAKYIQKGASASGEKITLTDKDNTKDFSLKAPK